MPLTEISPNTPIQGLVSDMHRRPPQFVSGLGGGLHDEIEVWESHVRDRQRKTQRAIFGPRVDGRKRKKRLRKKLAKRGHMRRCRGVIQSTHRAWPAMKWLWT